MQNMSESATLISPQYRSEQERLHEQGHYGTVSIQFAPMVSQIIDRLEVSHLLDYGCGSQTNLAKHLNVNRRLTYQAYDPGVPRFSKPPVSAQMVACIDVLEHIEPDLIDNVLDDLRRLTEVVLFATVTTVPAFKTLSDGRNAHLIQKPMEWWLPKFWARWELQTVQVVAETTFMVVALAKSSLESADGKLI